MHYVTFGFPAWQRQVQIMGYVIETSGTRCWAISSEGLETGAFESGIDWAEHPPAEIQSMRMERGI